MIIKNISGEIQTGIDTGFPQIGILDVGIDKAIQVIDSLGHYYTQSMQHIFEPVVEVGTGSEVYEGASPSTHAVGAMPAGTDTYGRTFEDLWEDATTDPSGPSVQLRGTPSFGLFEVGDSIANPAVDGNGALGSAPAGILTQLEIFRGGLSVFVQTNPVPGSWYGYSDTIALDIVAGTSETYSAVINDDQGRSGSTSRTYEGTYPFFGTTVDIATLTGQSLRPLTSSYFSVNMVAETGGDKYKADFEDAYITITGIQFYNTVSSAREWMGGSKANSLLLRDVTVETHTIQGNVTNYNRYTHNGPDGGAINLRFFTN